MTDSASGPAQPVEAVLVVDDEDKDRNFSVEILKKEGFNVQAVSSGWSAVELMEKTKFDLIITDIVMPGMSGFDVIAAACKSNPEAICIAMTGYGSLDSAMDALRLGAYSFLTKPCDPGEFRHCVQRGLEKQRLTKELRLRNMELEQLNRELDSKVQEATLELVNLNRRMLTEMASLQEVDRLKTAFLDNVSHDLKSPLTTIQAYIEIFIETVSAHVPDDGKKCLHSVRNALAHMKYLINQLVEAAQLKSGKIKLDLQTLPVADVLEESLALALAQAEAKNIHLETPVERNSGLTVLADRGRLLQILNNLLSNACKFTPNSGRVVVRTWPENACVHFCVEDTGPGIAVEHHSRIFDRFYQVDSSPSREFKGLGLGLRIAKDLVDLHKGNIWVESEPGKGSKFHFVIPQG